MTSLGGELDVKVYNFPKFSIEFFSILTSRYYFVGKEGLVPSNFMQSDQNNGVLVNPIHDACKRGNYELLVECLMNKVPINVQDKAGNSALHWACRGGVCVKIVIFFYPEILSSNFQEILT